MDAVFYSDAIRRAQEEDAAQRWMERAEQATEGTPQSADWASLSSEVVEPCLGCVWTLLWAPYTRWQEMGRGHDRRVGLRLVRRLRRLGFRARIVPSRAVESTVGQMSFMPLAEVAMQRAKREETIDGYW